ncbi:AAA family ATPase [Microcella alkaliphila]|uniref:RecF/RecN/SMC N-terminal domain-containing protein n=1 Tax=Microcella alkaliphila TaxID=279828 RepID=A0A0U5B706_9MICO|nr:ATP-binding protein [Microcella alkaliphila]BAU31673.1 RecF/RecN/SMC N-terminal domain-containing protein [Microcella alkaliphila]
MLERIRIERFKSISDSTIDLARVNVLVGPNNAGKSSVLQAMQFAVSVAQSLKLDGSASWRSDVLAGSLATQQLIYTPLRDVQALAAGGALRQGDSSAIAVSFFADGGTKAAVTVKRGKNRNIAVKIAGRELGEQLSLVETPFSVVSPGLAGMPAYEEFKSPGLVRRAAARGDANSVFRNVLWTLRQDPPGWKEFSDSLRRVFHDIQIDVEFNEQTDEHINATITREGLTLPIDAAGTGVLQAIQVLSYISVYKPKLLILDEPDSHLHPDNQRKLMRLIASEAEDRDFQVVMSSHSRHIIDETGSLGANLLWFSGGTLRSGDFDQVAALLELGALDAGDRLKAGATELVVLTEDDRTGGLNRPRFDAVSFRVWKDNVDHAQEDPEGDPAARDAAGA